MKCLCGAIIKKTRFLELKLTMFHAANLPTHTAINLLVFGENGTKVIPHPPHLPDLVTVDFFVPQIENDVGRPMFPVNDSIKENSLMELCSVLNEEFQKCFKGWKKCWEWCTCC